MPNHLYYGDNLTVLREHIADESIDLVYLDPPFNSQANYNILFRAPTGEQSKAQIEAFEDTWHWNDSAERAFDAVMQSGNTDAAEMLRAMRVSLKENDMMAYLTMMAVRLLELHRVLKATGSIYLHCDPTASHYLKILMDAIFDQKNLAVLHLGVVAKYTLSNPDNRSMTIDMRTLMTIMETKISPSQSDLPAQVYHGTCLRLWKKSGVDVGFNLYVVADRDEAESYADESCTTARDKPIIVSFRMQSLLSLVQSHPSVELDPDWGWVDAYENDLKYRGEALERNPTWRESLKAVGSFCVASFKDEFKHLGSVTKL